MSDSITREVMLATFNKEQTAPIASANPYDARATAWFKMATCHNSRCGVWGMRITKIYLAGPWGPEPNKRLASNRGRGMDYRFSQRPAQVHALKYSGFSFGKTGLCFLVVRSQWSSICLLRRADCAGAAIDSLRLRKPFNTRPKRKKWRCFMEF